MLNQFLKRFAIVFMIPMVFMSSSCAAEKRIILNTKIRQVSNPTYGNVDFEVSTKDFLKAGFNYDDIIDVKIKNWDGKNHDALLTTAFVKSFNETGYYAPCLCNYEGTKDYFELNFAINPLKDEKENLVGKDVEFKMSRKKGYKKKRELVNVSKKLSYEELGGDDSMFANFRDIDTSGAIYKKIRPHIIYRGSSPFNNVGNPDGRREIADKLMDIYGIDSEISLCCTESEIEKYMESYTDSCTYIKWLESKDKVKGEKTFYSVNLGTDFFDITKEGADGKAVKNVFEYISERIDKNADANFYIHCNEGKDRTSFIVAVLEALAGIPLKDIVLDYMSTFRNYYDVSVTNNKEKYDTLAELGIYRYLYSILIDSDTPLEVLKDIDWYNFNATEMVNSVLEGDPSALQKGAEHYLKNVIKVSQDSITKIKEHLEY